MGRLTEVPDTLWDQGWFVRLSPDEKALYFYLDTGNRSISGIYGRTLDDMWFKTRVDQQVITMALEMGNLRGIKYDPTNEAVFILDKYRRNQRFGGDPALIDKAIMNDHWETRAAIAFWEEWCAIYETRVAGSIALTNHFLYPSQPEPDAKRRPRKKRAAKEDESVVEGQIQEHLARYRVLPKGVKAVFNRVYMRLTRTARGRPLPVAARVAFLEDLSVFHVEQVGIAAEIFERTGGFDKDLPVAWFKGVLKKGAVSEHVERTNEENKRERGEKRE